MKKTLLLVILVAIILSSCGNHNTEVTTPAVADSTVMQVNCDSSACDSTKISVDSLK